MENVSKVFPDPDSPFYIELRGGNKPKICCTRPGRKGKTFEPSQVFKDAFKKLKLEHKAKAKKRIIKTVWEKNPRYEKARTKDLSNFVWPTKEVTRTRGPNLTGEEKAAKLREAAIRSAKQPKPIATISYVGQETLDNWENDSVLMTAVFASMIPQVAKEQVGGLVDSWATLSINATFHEENDMEEGVDVGNMETVANVDVDMDETETAVLHQSEVNIALEASRKRHPTVSQDQGLIMSKSPGKFPKRSTPPICLSDEKDDKSSSPSGSTASTESYVVPCLRYPLPKPGVGLTPAKKSVIGRCRKNDPNPKIPKGNRTQEIIEGKEIFAFQKRLKRTKSAEFVNPRPPKGTKWMEHPPTQVSTRRTLCPEDAAKIDHQGTSHLGRDAAQLRGIRNAKSEMNGRTSVGDTQKASVSSSRDPNDPAMEKIKNRNSGSLQRPSTVPDSLWKMKDPPDQRKRRFHKMPESEKQKCAPSKQSPTTSRLPQNAEQFDNEDEMEAGSGLEESCVDNATASQNQFASAPPIVPFEQTSDHGMELDIASTDFDHRQPEQGTYAVELSVEEALQALEKALDTKMNKRLAEKPKHAWGPFIDPSFQESLKVTVPPRVTDFTKDWNAKELDKTETELVEDLGACVKEKFLQAIVNAVNYGMKRSSYRTVTANVSSVDPEGRKVMSQQRKINEKSDTSRVPEMSNLIHDILSKFTDEMNCKRIFATLPGGKSLKKGRPQKGEIMVKHLPPKDEANANELLGRNMTDQWGVIRDTQLYLSDAVATLGEDWTSNTIDALGFLLEDESFADRNMDRFRYFEIPLQQILFGIQDFNHADLQPLIDELRFDRTIDTILLPFHQTVDQDHWTMVRIHIRQSTISMFDPFQQNSRLGSRLLEGKKKLTRKDTKSQNAAQDLIHRLRVLRNFMSHVFPEQVGWQIEENTTWPMEMVPEIIPEIPRQGVDRECGPIVGLAMEYMTRSPNFNDKRLQEMLMQRRWVGVRYNYYRRLQTAMGILAADLPEVVGQMGADEAGDPDERFEDE